MKPAELDAIRERDKASAETWFKPLGTKGFGACGQAFIDRRALLAELDRMLTAIRERDKGEQGETVAKDQP